MEFFEKVKKSIITKIKKALLTLKKYFKKEKNKLIFKRIFWLMGGFLVLLSLFIFLILSIYGPWWKIWPQNIEANIALNRLAVSVYNEPYCRTNCYLERELYRQSIIKKLDKVKFIKKLEKIILDEEENLNWRLELIKILALNDLNLDLSSFQDYLNKNSGNLEIKKALNYYFKNNLKNSDYLNNLKISISDNSISENEKVLALKNLALAKKSEANFYLALLSTNLEEDFQLEVLKALASDQLRFSLPLNDLSLVLEKIIYSSSYYQSKRISLFILADFLEDSKNIEIHDLFVKIIEDQEIDKFTKYLAIDILNNYLEEKYDVLEIAPFDWDYYYQEK